MSIRAFIGIELPVAIRNALDQVRMSLKPQIKNAKWVPKDDVHLTLKFLGDISEEQVDEVEQALSAACDGFRRFYFCLGDLGAFPNTRRARVLWAGITHGASELVTLSRAIDMDLAEIGFEPEQRDFKAHITLARIKVPANVEQALSGIQPATFSGRIVNVNKVVLFKSTLTPSGSKYDILRDVHLNL